MVGVTEINFDKQAEIEEIGYVMLEIECPVCRIKQKFTITGKNEITMCPNCHSVLGIYLEGYASTIQAAGRRMNEDEKYADKE